MLTECSESGKQHITSGGNDAKTAKIRSSEPINLIHEAVKQELINGGVCAGRIFPPLQNSKPELKLAGFLKPKNQDICVLPSNATPIPEPITWGPMAHQGEVDSYGTECTEKVLTVNVRSQMSSIAKNSDTLFERTFAEALNLHLRCPGIVLGDVYMIPVYEYDVSKNNTIAFKSNKTNVEKYISFFNFINERKLGGESYKYERCALLIVDFRKEQPYLYRDSDSLKRDGIISKDFPIDFAPLSFDNFARDILAEYRKRFPGENIGR